MQEKNKRCPHCGATMKEYWQGLTPALVNILIHCIEAVKRNGANRFHWEKDVRHNVNESHNFHKLRIHGLIARAEPDNPRSGYWLITDRGGKFLRGEISVPRRVRTFRGHVVGHDDVLVNIKSLRLPVPWYQKDFEFEIHEGKFLPNLNKQQTLI